jgi:hypothetical protein
MKRGNKTDKRGQFYLISAVVLAMLVVGIFTISNYSKKESDVELDIMKEEIQTESAYVMDYWLYKGLSDTALYSLLLDFTGSYIDYQRKDKDLYFVFGDQNNITVTGYQETEKQVSVSSGSSAVITGESGEFIGGIDPATDTLTLSIDDMPYEFELNSGKNFYFVLSQKVNKGEHIITG